MMSNMVPKNCLKGIHQIQRQFIWRYIEGKNQFHTISWDKITKLKQEGGLGLRKLTLMNKACLTKLGWKFYKGNNDLWCKVMYGKYGRNNLHDGIGEAKVQDSSLWKNLVNI